MKQFREISGIKAYAICLCLILIALPAASGAGSFTIIRVYDGDTVRASGHDIEFNLRLLGIDAPEVSDTIRRKSQPFGKAAQQFLADLVLNKTVEIKGYGLDPGNHVLAVIQVGGIDVNLALVEAGLAEVNRSRSAGNDIIAYRRAEEAAREAYKGIWSLGKYYIAPEEWRRAHPRQGP